MAFVILSLAMVGMVVAAIIMRAWVFTVLWDWFAVPYGLPAITIATAIGIALIVSMFTSRRGEGVTKKVNSLSDLTGEVMGHAFGGPLAILFIGWVVTWFM